MTLDDILRQIFGGGGQVQGMSPGVPQMGDAPPMYDPMARKYASEAQSPVGAPRLAAGGQPAPALPEAASPPRAAPMAAVAPPAASADPLGRTADAGPSFGQRLSDFGMALQGHRVPDRAAEARALDAQRLGQNLTYQALIKKGVEPEIAKAAIANPEFGKQLLGQVFAKPQEAKTFEVGGRLVRIGPDGKAEEVYASPDGAAGASEYGTTIQYAQMPDGTVKGFVVSKGGTTKDIDPGGGATLLGPEGIAAAKARGTTGGKTLMEAKAALPKAIEQASTILGQLDALETDPDLGRMVGPVQGRLPNLTGAANRVQSKLDQITGGAFLQAFQMLKGGGQITEIEGKKATDAITRLGNLRQDEPAFRAAINELRTIARNGAIRARVAAGELPESALSEIFDVEQFRVPSERSGSAPAVSRNPRGVNPAPSGDGFKVEYE